MRATIFILFLIYYCDCAHERKITFSINPGCTSGCEQDKNVLIHIKADGPNDTVHHIWDFTKKPSVLLSVTPLNTNLTINWEKFLVDGDYETVSFTSQPHKTFSFAIDQVVEFNDSNNTATYDPTVVNGSDANIFSTNEYNWILKSHDDTNRYAKAVMEAEHWGRGSPSGKPGLIRLVLTAFGTAEHSETQPHLLHTTNATQIDVVLEELATSFNESRFALGMCLVTSDPANGTMRQLKMESLDDEHSPGVFTVGQLEAASGYVEWRVVAYTSPERLMTASTSVTNSTLSSVDDPLSSLNRTLMYSLFGANLTSMFIRHVYISFGQPGDGFYKLNRYLSWTFLGGVGSPAVEDFSMMVRLIIIVGIGLPVLLIIVGTVWILLKNLRRSHGIVFHQR